MKPGLSPPGAAMPSIVRPVPGNASATLSVRIRRSGYRTPLQFFRGLPAGGREAEASRL